MKLSEDDVVKALYWRSNGLPVKTIAYRLNVCGHTVSRYMRNFQRYGSSFWTDHPEEIDPLTPVAGRGVKRLDVVAGG